MASGCGAPSSHWPAPVPSRSGHARCPDRGGLHDPGDHQVAEGLVFDHAEPKAGVDPGQCVEQQPRPGRDDPAWTIALSRPPGPGPGPGPGRPKSAAVAAGSGLPPAAMRLPRGRASPDADRPAGHGHAPATSELGRSVGRADMLDDPLPPARGVLSDLHRRSARGRTNLPDECHPETLRPTA
jgi:hypothetical protein